MASDGSSEITGGTECEIYSTSKGQWYSGTITSVFVRSNERWFTVSYNNGTRVKKIQRFSKNLRIRNHSSLFAIGQNDGGELGFEHCSQVQHLTLSRLPPDLIPHEAAGYILFADRQFQRILSVGFNRYGHGLQDPKVMECTHISYFRDRQIRLKKICTNPWSDTVFFIRDHLYSTAYGVGSNQGGALNSESRTRYLKWKEPIYIDRLSGVVDIQSGGNYSVALCSLIFEELKHLPDDIQHLIKRFLAKYTKVYATMATACLGSGHVSPPKN